MICCKFYRVQKINPNEIVTQKFIFELNGALAMENAGVERLQSRINEVSLPEVKQQLEHHLSESKQHQERLSKLITDLGGQTTTEKLGLPLPSYPQSMQEIMDSSMTKQEWELKKSEFDMIVENAEVSCYLALIQKAQMAGGVFLNAIEPLSLNLKDEQAMVDFIKTTSPAMLAKLWPQIQSAIATASSV